MTLIEQVRRKIRSMALPRENPTPNPSKIRCSVIFLEQVKQELKIEESDEIVNTHLLRLKIIIDTTMGDTEFQVLR